MNELDFAPIDPNLEQRLLASIGTVGFPKMLGLRMEAVRRDYARMRLPYRPELNQPAGIVHGGAIASLIDTAVVGTIFSGQEEPPARLLTLDMSVHYLDAVVEEDAIAEAWTRRRGRSIIFLAVEVKTASGKPVAHGELTYKVVMSKRG